jgi:hypothetical protein
MVSITMELTKEADQVANGLKFVFEVQTKSEAINKLLEASKHLVIEHLKGGNQDDRA